MIGAVQDVLTPQGLAALATLVGAVTGMILALRKNTSEAAAGAIGEADAGPQGVKNSAPPKA